MHSINISTHYIFEYILNGTQEDKQVKWWASRYICEISHKTTVAPKHSLIFCRFYCKEHFNTKSWTFRNFIFRYLKFLHMFSSNSPLFCSVHVCISMECCLYMAVSVHSYSKALFKPHTSKGSVCRVFYTVCIICITMLKSFFSITSFGIWRAPTLCVFPN